MAGPYTDLPAKPLVEAILEIKWRLKENKDPAYPLYTGLLAGRVSDTFPTQERLPAADVPDELTPHLVKFRFRAGRDEWPVIQAGPGVVTLNVTDGYTWEVFHSLATYLWDNLQEAYSPFNGDKPPEATHLQLRYINSVPLSGADPESFLKQKLHTSLSLPQTVSEKHSSGPVQQAALSVAYPVEYEGTTGALKFQSAKQNGVDIMLFELLADTEFGNPPTAQRFGEWLSYVHELLEDWFFALVDGELLASFLGGTDGSSDN